MSLFFLEDFSDKLIEMYISKSVNILTNKIHQNKYEHGEETIYKYKNKRLIIWCDYTSFQLVFLNGSNHYVLFTSNYELNNLDVISQKVLDIYLELTSNNQQLECCNNCTIPFYSKVSKSDIIEDYCYECEVFRMLMIRKYLASPLECNICYIKNIEQNNNKIKYTPMNVVTCCKNKNLCINCLSQINNKCNCTNCSVSCPFCKQVLKTEEI